MKRVITQRGFLLYTFADRNGVRCSLQKSSLSTEDCVWLGCDEIGLRRFEPGNGWSAVELQQDHPFGIVHVANTRMHLSREQVKVLLPLLTIFAETGELRNADLIRELVGEEDIKRDNP